ncbi:MAG: N-6 DNA methylase, partial [Nitrospirota bacterium]
MTYTTAIEIREKLCDALVAYFLNENDKLGLGIETRRIHDICKILIAGNEETSNTFPAWEISEQTIFDEYRNKEVEIMDYLHLVSIDPRKKFGQYATPKDIVTRILKSVGYISAKDILTKRLIDPACGSGAFLVEATRLYLNALKVARVPRHGWYPEVIAAITGIDIDPEACFFARLNLSTLLAPSILEFISRNGTGNLRPLPVYCADTLQVVSSEKKNSPLFYGRPTIQVRERFDFVVGNPPYFKIKNIGQDIKDAFSESIYGHPNAYALFIQAGIEMLNKDGRLGFIIPRSMLSGLYFKNLRNFIEINTSIKEIIHIADRKKVFDDVLHGAMILSLERNSSEEKKISISFVQSRKDIKDCDSTINVDAGKVMQHLNGTSVWFVADSAKVYNIIDRVIKRHHLLSGQEINYRAKTGQIVWNRVKPLLATKPEE